MVFWTSATKTRRWLICLTAATISIAAIGLGVGVYFIVHQPYDSFDDAAAASNTPTPAVSISLAIPAGPLSPPSALISTTSTMIATETVSVSVASPVIATATETQTVSVTPTRGEQSFLAPILPTTFTSITITVLPTVSPSPFPSSSNDDSGGKKGGDPTPPEGTPHVTGKEGTVSTIWMTMTALSLVSEPDGKPSQTEYFTITAHLDTLVSRARATGLVR